VKYGGIGNGSVHSFRFDAGVLSLISFDDPLEPESIDEQNALESREGGAV
jgi:hypothetical protein